SSEKMQKVVNRLRDFYDYIILDLPPVGEVSDAMAVAGVMDGVLLVARQNYGNRVAFSSAVKQFEFTGVKILGVVLNRATDGAEGKKYYKRYGYYSKYEKSYMEAAEKAVSRQQDKQ
ncbi:MAG: hypothetical protein IJ333_10840, partial [Clostridia bacterium]|nr:hypothetical protein [Clostridia bacterium]